MNNLSITIATIYVIYLTKFFFHFNVENRGDRNIHRGIGVWVSTTEVDSVNAAQTCY